MAWAVCQVFLEWTQRFQPLGLHDFGGFLGQVDSDQFGSHLRPLTGRGLQDLLELLLTFLRILSNLSVLQGAELLSFSFL